jgi:hypothetical protein
MKYLKTKNISKFSISDRTLIAYPNGNGPGNRVVINATGGLVLPKGTGSQRPQTVGVRQQTDANGTIRYNTTTTAIEAYVGDEWITVAQSSGSAIIRRSYGPGNGEEIFFGPLEVSFATSYSASDHNVLVLVENVMQIGENINYTIVQNPPGVALATYGVVTAGQPYPTGYYLQFTSPVPDTGNGGNPVNVTVYYGYAT